MRVLSLILVLFSVKCFAQYPFEKYSPVKYNKVAIDGSLTTDSCGKIFVFKNYIIRFLCNRERDSSNIILSYRDKIIKRIKAPFNFSPIMVFDPIFIGDIDGNGLTDFKIQLDVDGSGLAGSLKHKIYLFNQGHHKFKAIYFCDFSANIERDFNSDGNFEIIGESYLSYKNHAYWVFDLYDYVNGKLVNVSKRYHYPILIQFLYSRENHRVTPGIPPTQMSSFSKPVPQDYKNLDAP